MAKGGACMVNDVVCMAKGGCMAEVVCGRGHAWQGDAWQGTCVAGGVHGRGMHGRRHVWWRGMCGGGHVW